MQFRRRLLELKLSSIKWILERENITSMFVFFFQIQMQTMFPCKKAKSDFW